MINNSTSEQWIWHEGSYANMLMNPKYDFADNGFTWFVMTNLTKCWKLISAVFGFILLSFVNGMIIRIALLCSNVVIFPLVYMMECYAANAMNTQ